MKCIIGCCLFMVSIFCIEISVHASCKGSSPQKYLKLENKNNSQDDLYLPMSFEFDKHTIKLNNAYKKIPFLKVFCSAKEGVKLSQLYLGVLFEKGVYVNQNYKEARKWYKKAAREVQGRSGYYVAGEWHRSEVVVKKVGNNSAMYRLAYLYALGKGGKRNAKKVKALLATASFHDYAPAYKWYSVIDWKPYFKCMKSKSNNACNNSYYKS